MEEVCRCSNGTEWPVKTEENTKYFWPDDLELKWCCFKLETLLTWPILNLG